MEKVKEKSGQVKSWTVSEKVNRKVGKVWKVGKITRKVWKIRRITRRVQRKVCNSVDKYGPLMIMKVFDTITSYDLRSHVGN